MRRWMMMVGLLWLSASPAWAVWGVGDVVFDPTNFEQNLTTAISTAEMLRRYTADLALLEDFSQYSAVIGRASVLAQQVFTLSTRLRGRYVRWTALIPNGGEFIPCTVKMLVDWRTRYDLDTKESIFDGALAQTLMSEGSSVLSALPEILTVARTITGTVSGSQSLHSLIAQLVQSFTTAATMRAPMDEGESRLRMRTLVEDEAKQVILDNIYAGIELRQKRTCQPIAGL